MTELAEERLQEIEARAAKATEGPWKHYRARLRPNMGTAVNEVQATGWPAIIQWGGFDNSERRASMHAANARFIAAARQDVPDLVAEVRRLREERALLEMAVEALTPFARVADMEGDKESGTKSVFVALGRLRDARSTLTTIKTALEGK